MTVRFPVNNKFQSGLREILILTEYLTEQFIYSLTAGKELALEEVMLVEEEEGEERAIVDMEIGEE